MSSQIIWRCGVTVRPKRSLSRLLHCDPSLVWWYLPMTCGRSRWLILRASRSCREASTARACRTCSALAKAGITVVLDRWENARIGASVPRFVERISGADQVIVVGTPSYRTKYDNNEPMGAFVVW